MNLPINSHIHLIGICGTAMASLAGLLKSSGYRVTGSDQNVYPPMSTQLQELGITIQTGYKKENLNPRPDLVIVGNVISRSNPEAEALLASDIPYTSLPKAMGDFAIANRDCIVVAGTHGKTTTTSMMTWASDASGHKAGYMIGGIPENYGQSFRISKDNYFIIEGDEYDTAFFDKVPKFIHYKPKLVILTSVEFDHADIYKDLEAVKDSFRKLLALIPKDGVLIANNDNKNVVDLIKEVTGTNPSISKYGYKICTYGVGPSDYRLLDRDTIDGRNHFAVEHSGKRIADIAIKQSGEYNALNALAVYAMARELKWDLNKTLQGLASFAGVKRRQQVLGTPNNITVIEDFAHHPTAVKVTLSGIKEKYIKGSGRLFALFEPRSATSRRKVFQNDYVKAFSESNFVCIAKPFDQTKINEADRFSSAELVADMRAGKIDAHEFDGADQIVEFVKKQARSGDVVVIMSNGAFDGIYQKLLKALA
jgi:UDP-N-acetylmuramate: L-alanyl-gamma-D-glutamyl-meso-diaminopimelate ligase